MSFIQFSVSFSIAGVSLLGIVFASKFKQNLNTEFVVLLFLLSGSLFAISLNYLLLYSVYNYNIQINYAVTLFSSSFFILMASEDIILDSISLYEAFNEITNKKKLPFINNNEENDDENPSKYNSNTIYEIADNIKSEDSDSSGEDINEETKFLQNQNSMNQTNNSLSVVNDVPLIQKYMGYQKNLSSFIILISSCIYNISIGQIFLNTEIGISNIIYLLLYTFYLSFNCGFCFILFEIPETLYIVSMAILSLSFFIGLIIFNYGFLMTEQQIGIVSVFYSGILFYLSVIKYPTSLGRVLSKRQGRKLIILGFVIAAILIRFNT